MYQESPPQQPSSEPPIMKRKAEKVRKMHDDFQSLLDYKEKPLIELFHDCRSFVLELFPESNELLYHTHALTAVFSLSEKLSNAFCLLPIYTNHLNLGFSQGTRLDDPHGLLTGTGKLMRHIPIAKPTDYRNDRVAALLKSSVEVATESLKEPTRYIGQTFSKIK